MKAIHAAGALLINERGAEAHSVAGNRAEAPKAAGNSIEGRRIDFTEGDASGGGHDQ